jgi:hypothetical protein
MQEYNSFITYLKGIERSLMSSDSEVVRYSSSEDTNYAKYKGNGLEEYNDIFRHTNPSAYIVLRAYVLTG